MDNADVDPTPLTLPELAPRAAPTMSGQKRESGRRGEDGADTGTSRGGKRLPSTTREEARADFREAPLLLDAA